MSLRRSITTFRNQAGVERMGRRTYRVIRIGEDYGSGERFPVERGFALGSVAPLVFRLKMYSVAADGSFQFVAIQVAAEFFAVLLQLKRQIDRRTVKVRAHHPPSGKSVGRREGILGEQQPRKDQE